MHNEALGYSRRGASTDALNELTFAFGVVDGGTVWRAS